MFQRLETFHKLRYILWAFKVSLIILNSIRYYLFFSPTSYKRNVLIQAKEGECGRGQNTNWTKHTKKGWMMGIIDIDWAGSCIYWGSIMTEEKNGSKIYLGCLRDNSKSTEEELLYQNDYQPLMVYCEWGVTNSAQEQRTTDTTTISIEMTWISQEILMVKLVS